MKRRGFLGFMGGAAVAGPSMVKQAAASVAEDLALGQGVRSALGHGGISNTLDANWIGGAPVGGWPNKEDYGKTILQKLLGITAEQRARLKAQHADVGRLDPDLASYRSFSLSAKIEMQRERNVEALISERTSWWRKFVEGTADDDRLDLW